MNPTKIALVVGIPALLIGLVAGYLFGRASLEHQWADPTMTISQDDVSRSSSGGADPTPPAGAKVLRPMPIQRARLALRELTAKDPVKATVGSVGRDETEVDLHVMIANDSECEVIAYSGVAYAFNSQGFPEPFNKNGEQYIAFSSPAPKKVAPAKDAAKDAGAASDDGANDGDSDDETIAAKAHVKLERHVSFANRTNVVLAQIDTYTCKDGKRWARSL